MPRKGYRQTEEHKQKKNKNLLGPGPRPDMIKHGLVKHPLYSIWTNIKSRCSNPNILAYRTCGGHGIRICEAWKTDFKAFYDWAIANGYGPGQMLRKRKRNENYTPDNCFWKTVGQRTKQWNETAVEKNNSSITTGSSITAVEKNDESKSEENGNNDRSG
jgi:hypothetical protein